MSHGQQLETERVPLPPSFLYCSRSNKALGLVVAIVKSYEMTKIVRFHQTLKTKRNDKATANASFASSEDWACSAGKNALAKSATPVVAMKKPPQQAKPNGLALVEPYYVHDKNASFQVRRL
jgi:hypothetical protein